MSLSCHEWNCLLGWCNKKMGEAFSGRVASISSFIHDMINITLKRQENVLSIGISYFRYPVLVGSFAFCH